MARIQTQIQPNSFPDYPKNRQNIQHIKPQIDYSSSQIENRNSNRTWDFHPRISTQFDKKLQYFSETPSFRISIHSTKSLFNNHFNNKQTPQLYSKSSQEYLMKIQTNDLNQIDLKKTNRKNQEKKCCVPSRYCCLSLTLLICMFIAIGLASMFMAIFIPNITSTTTTTTTSTTVTTTTTTTQTTSTTTTTETTSTTTTETTTTTTTESTTTSTTTSSTSSTSTTTTTTANLCGGSISVPTSIIFQSTSFSSTSYRKCYFQWIPSSTGFYQIAFQFRSDIDHWHLDDVSISNGTTEILVNGDFETGSFSSGWTKSIPNGNCLWSTPGTHIATTLSYNGNYYVDSWCSGLYDQISQSFVAIQGHIYSVSFYLRVSGSVGTRSISVTLS